ncbi:hypothetical protein GDO81_018432 [Engystomops pustulosus]|uniref:Uncharacterized protein n=1 Tax=Engystomops pustulosus TaxID=76066 RepID=A0AAV6ZU24_ENGPU|nr:hypothetical protein GDO81_018432 [Engystomops pustulosus]
MRTHCRQFQKFSSLLLILLTYDQIKLRNIKSTRMPSHCPTLGFAP